MQTKSLVTSDRRDKNQCILRFGAMNFGVEELLVIEHDSMNDKETGGSWYEVVMIIKSR